jgi:phage recombination protein Bet
LKGVAEQYLKFLPICSDIDNQTKFQFLELCKNLELNPFKKEIYLILNRQKNKGGEYINVFTPVVNYEFYRRRAEDFGDMDGGIDIKTETDSDTGLPIKSTATLYRQGKSHPYTKTIYFNEFAKKSLDGRLQAMWARMPIFMLEKVAEATLLRMAYPKEFRGVPYITEELNDGEMINVPKEETSETEPEINNKKRLTKPEKPIRVCSH